MLWNKNSKMLVLQRMFGESHSITVLLHELGGYYTIPFIELRFITY
jgi:hypothetical protein